jgi:hypothetical protein
MKNTSDMRNILYIENETKLEGLLSALIHTG